MSDKDEIVGFSVEEKRANGRPRDVCPNKEEMIELGKEMVKWVIENKPLHLSQWYTIEKYYTYNEWKTMIVKKEFFPYYERALKLIGIQYLDKESRIRDSISQRWQRIYFRDLKEEEDETMKFKAECQKMLHDTVGEEQVTVDQINKILEHLGLDKIATEPKE